MSVTTEQQKTLDFLNELSEQAYDKAHQGDVTLLNRLAKQSTGFQFYFTNVSRTKTVSPEQFVAQYPALLTEAEAFRLDYEKSLKADENAERLNKVEEGLAAVLAAVKSLTESIEASAKPAKKDKKQDVVETTAVDKGEDSGESEA